MDENPYQAPLEPVRIAKNWIVRDRTTRAMTACFFLSAACVFVASMSPTRIGDRSEAA
jgi:hypothetical protein